MIKQFSTFKLGEALFGVNILMVNEINRHLDITPVAGAPNFVCGLLNLRGQIVTVVDLGVKLGLGPREIARTSCCIVLKTSQALAPHRDKELLDDDNTGVDVVGLLVDRIGDIIAVNDSQIDTPPANIGSVNGKYLSGVVKLDEELLVMLRLKDIIT